ncbi:MAG: AEC family transporter [Myxococcota bacterium]
MSNLVLVGACLVLGALLRRLPTFPADSSRALNAFVLYVALPAQILAKMRGVSLSTAALLPASMAWVQLGLVAVLVTGVGRALGWPRPVRAALMLTAGVANTSFVGWPLIEALVGPEGLPTAILCDQLGSFVVVSTAGVAIAAWGTGERASLRNLSRGLLRFPALYALAGALALHGIWLPPALTEVFDRLGATLTPLALVSVGLQLRVGGASSDVPPLAVGLATKLVAVPFALLGLYLAVGVDPGLPLRVTVLEGAMPPMITGAILAADRGLAPTLANRMVGIGIPLGVATVAAWSVALARWVG